MPDTSIVVPATSNKNTLEIVSVFITSIAGLLWPLVVFGIVLLFKTEISGILKRLKKGKIFGQELELDQKLDELEQATNEALQATPPIEDAPLNDKEAASVSEDIVDNILTKSAQDPKIGILQLSIEIERELNKLVFQLGLTTEPKYNIGWRAFEALAQRKFISPEVLKSVALFREVRNKVVHGKAVEDEAQLIRVLDIGATLLNILKSIPHAKHIVRGANIDLFSDARCEQPREDIVGVALETIPSTKRHIQVYPTQNRTYVIDEDVSWEWNMERKWGSTWYKNSDTDSIEKAWDSSAEFIGQPVQEL